jgi:hypothetical protein
MFKKLINAINSIRHYKPPLSKKEFYKRLAKCKDGRI